MVAACGYNVFESGPPKELCAPHPELIRRYSDAWSARAAERHAEIEAEAIEIGKKRKREKDEAEKAAEIARAKAIKTA